MADGTAGRRARHVGVIRVCGRPANPPQDGDSPMPSDGSTLEAIAGGRGCVGQLTMHRRHWPGKGQRLLCPRSGRSSQRNATLGRSHNWAEFSDTWRSAMTGLSATRLQTIRLFRSASLHVRIVTSALVDWRDQWCGCSKGHRARTCSPSAATRSYCGAGVGANWAGGGA